MVSNITPKSILHEVMMQRKLTPPLYEQIEERISQIGFKYFVKASNIIAVGTGRNKREAQHNGAAIVLKLLSMKGIEHRSRHGLRMQGDGGEEQGPPINANCVGRLSTFCMAQELAEPIYTLTVTGPAHQAVFTVHCSAYGFTCAASSGQKKRAKAQASADMLEKLTTMLPDSTTGTVDQMHASTRNALRRRNKRANNSQ